MGREQGATTLAIEVQDDGIGISPEQLENLFTAFTQADSTTTRRFGGTGLGLVIARRLVRAMQGEIAVESESRRGSCFSFTFVVADALDPTGANVLAEARPVAHATQPIRGAERYPPVLVAEDNAINQKVMAATLERMGLRAQLVDNGQMAVDALRASTDYSVVFMDCQMPVMDGYTAARTIRDDERTTGRTRATIIAVTAHALSGERERVLAAGMDDYITKPVHLAELRRCLVRWLTGSRPAT